MASSLDPGRYSGSSSAREGAARESSLASHAYFPPKEIVWTISHYEFVLDTPRFSWRVKW